MDELWLEHRRWGTHTESTISTLTVTNEGGSDICYLIEDQYQEGEKVPGETCIPTGTYEIELRTDSPKFAHYYDRWDWYRGMPWLQDVPGFTFIYYHPGQDDDDSLGCGITGLQYEEKDDGNWQIQGGTSRPAFHNLCQIVYSWKLDRGARVWVKVTDDELQE